MLENQQTQNNRNKLRPNWKKKQESGKKYSTKRYPRKKSFVFY